MNKIAQKEKPREKSESKKKKGGEKTDTQIILDKAAKFGESNFLPLSYEFFQSTAPHEPCNA